MMTQQSGEWRSLREAFCAREYLGYLNDYVKSHFVPLLMCTGCVGALWPRASRDIKDLVVFYIPGTTWPFDLLTCALCCMMFSASTQCRGGDFIRLAKTPRAFFVGISLLYFLLPVVGWTSANLCTAYLGPTIGPQISAGLVLVVLMPVGMTSCVWVKLASGNLSLLLSLLTCTTALSLVVTPIYMSAILGAARSEIHVPTALLVKQLLIAVIAPMMVGMLLRAWCEAWVKRWQAAFALAGSFGLHVIVFANVGVALPALHNISVLTLGIVVGLTIALTVLNYGIAYLLGYWTHLSYEDRVTTCMVGGMRSIGTALVVGLTSFLTYPFVTVPAALYIIMQHLVAGQLIKFLHKEQAGVAAEPEPLVGLDYYPSMVESHG